MNNITPVTQKITPAILPKSFSELEEKLRLVVKAGKSDWVQIDAVDGIFAKNKTWPYQNDEEMRFPEMIYQTESLPYLDHIKFEIDLMVSDPRFEADKWIAAGASRLVLHIDSIDQAVLVDVARKIAAKGVELALGFGLHSSFEKLQAYINSVNSSESPKVVSGIQCMGIEKIGFQGQVFELIVLEHIRKIKEIYPGLLVSIDGGVNITTAPKLVEAGVDRLVIGSALFSKDKTVGEAIDEFSALFA